MINVAPAPHAASTTTLTDLPNELLEIIIDNVHDADLTPLRLMNRKLETIATCRFATMYFTHIKVFMSRRSLQMLNDICGHPKFASKVESIDFASQRLLKAGLESAKVSMLAAEENCQFVQATIDAAMDFTLAYSLAYSEQKSMAESGEAVLLLTNALDKLQCSRHPISLGLVDGVWTYPDGGVLGSYTFGKDCFEQYNSWNYWECVRSGTLKTLLSAAYRSRCHIKRLSIRFEDWAYKIPSEDDFAEQEDPDMGTIDIVEGFETHILANVCSRLSVFELKLLNSFHDWEGATPASTARILELAINLEVLRVDVGGASYSDFARGLTELSHWEELEVLTSAMSTKCLRELHLSNCVVPQEEMIELLVRNRATFHCLEISNCCIGWNGSWSAFFTWILESEIRLDRLILTDLYRELPGDRYYPVEFIVAGTREFMGSENMETELQGFVSELEAADF